MSRLNLIGKVFGRYEVLKPTTRTAAGKWKWLCLCDCGAEKEVVGSALMSGNTVSCGCHRADQASARMAEIKPTHRMSRTPIYRAWDAMIQRCTNPRSSGYENYGGRGIKVCERWRLSFENFYADMGERPEGMSLDRYPDMNGNYEPGNCRWATRSEQQKNTRPRARDESGRFNGELA